MPHPHPPSAPPTALVLSHSIMVLRLCVLLSFVLAMAAAQEGSGLSPDFEVDLDMQYGNMNATEIRGRHFYVR